MLQLLEEDGGMVQAHLQLLHVLLVRFHNGGIAELLLEFTHEIVPMGVSISCILGVTRVVGPEVLSSVGPPVSGVLREERGGKYDHEKGYSSELVMEHLEVGDTVPKESVHIVVLSFKRFG